MELIDKTLEKCLRAGADMAEAYLQSETTMKVTVRDGRVDSINKAAPSGLAIRYFSSGKMAFAHTTDFSDTAIDKLIAGLRNLGSKVSEDKYAVLPSQQMVPSDLQINAPEYAQNTIDSKIEYILSLEKLAFDYDPIIAKSNGITYYEFVTTKTIANTKGVDVSFDLTSYGIGLSLVAVKGGQMFPGEGQLWARRFDNLPAPDKIIDIIAGRALRLIGGRPVSSGDYEIIFAPRAANSILRGLAEALNGDNAFTGSSFLDGKTGKKVAADLLTVYDDPFMPWGTGSCPADDEGVVPSKQALIENGVLKGFLYDSRTAAKAGTTSTGSAHRDYYAALPVIAVSNFYIAPGTGKIDDVIANCRKGIIVEMASGWGLQAVNGQYSAGINGILVENGKKIRPVADVTVGGSADDILGGLLAVCDDIDYYDNLSSPSLYVKKMTVGA
jgi:PmbA protein